MKKLLFIAMALLAIVSCRQAQQYRVIVTFPDNATDGDTAYLTSYDSGDTILSEVIANKNVVLGGELNSNESFMARLIVNGKRVLVAVEGGDIHVTWADGKVTGTPLNTAMEALDKELEAIEAQAEKDTTEAGAAAAEPMMSQRFYDAFVANKENAIGPWAFNYFLMYNNFSPAQIDTILNDAPQYYRDLTRVKQAINAAKQLEITAEGKPFVDFAALDGRKLSDFAGKGKYTLVDFWASWCGPCRREIPNIKGLYQKYSSKMNFVGVAVWDKPDDTKQAITELQIPWPVLEGGVNWKEPTDLYGISGIPHIMLVAPDGNIVARGLAGDKLIEAVDKAMQP